MNIDSVSEFLASIAIAFFIADLLAQTLKLYKAKTSEEISLSGLVIRTLGMSFFVLRFQVTGDTALFIGQGIFLVLMLIYSFMAFKYRKKPRVN